MRSDGLRLYGTTRRDDQHRGVMDLKYGCGEHGHAASTLQHMVKFVSEASSDNIFIPPQGR